MSIRRDFQIGDIKVHLGGNIVDLEGVVAELKLGGRQFYIPIDFSQIIDQENVDINDIDIKSIAIANIIAYFEYMRLVPNETNDLWISKDFFKKLESLKDKDFIYAGRLLGADNYGKRNAQFKLELQEILNKLQKMGFNVKLNPNEVFVFTFVNRKSPLEIKVPKYTPVLERDLMDRVIDIEDYKQFYTIDDVLEVVESKLKPVEGKKYMKSFLATWQEFQDIAYKDGKITVIKKKL